MNYAISDTERLEWFAQQDGHYSIRHLSEKGLYVVWKIDDGLELVGEGATIQIALDQAMGNNE